MTSWGIFRDFVNSKEIGHVFIRQDLILFARLKQINKSTLLGYCSFMQQAKFIMRIGRGKYQLVDHLPEGLTMGSLFALLRGDNLSYVEGIQKQKDFNLLKEQFLKERKEVLERLIRYVGQYIPEAETIEAPAFGLKQLVRKWKRELDKATNPTRTWLNKRK